MSRYIDADALKDFFSNIQEELGAERISFKAVNRAIDALPEENYKPKRGKWLPVKASIYPYGNDVKCSVCGHRMGSSFGYNFCPMCGTDMREREGE